MADKQLFDGHKYTFNKVSGSLILLDSTDNSHETIIFREGLVASGSLPIDIKSDTSGRGLRFYAHNENQLTAQLISNNDDSQFNMYRNGVNAFYVQAGAANYSDFIYAKSHTNDGSYNIAIFYNGDGRVGLQIRSDGKVYTDGGDFYVRNPANTAQHTRVHTTDTNTYIDYPAGDFIVRQSSGTTTRFRLDGSVVDKLGHLRPTANDAYDVGSSALKWDDIRATNGTINTSDRTLKEHISGSNLGLSFINDLNPVSYRWIGKNRNHYGLIAQEVSESLARHNVNTADFGGYIKDDIYHRTKQNYVPDNNNSGSYEVEEDYQSIKEITNNPDLDINDFTYSSTTLGLRYTEFISPLIKAVQELSTKVTSLEARIAELENN